MGKNVAVFVDVANIFYAAKAAGVDIDYVTLLKAATAGRDFVRAYAYTGLDPENENQRNFHSFLARHGYKVVSKDIRKYGDGKVKANLDIELVVDMMKTARNLDVAVVISGDGDFAPAIRAVQEMGVRVEVVSFRGNTSSDLIEVADLFTDITQIAKVEKGSVRSGRRVADDEEDLSMTEVPEKQTEGTGRGRGRGGRGRPRTAEPEPVAARAPRGRRTAAPAAPVAQAAQAAPAEPSSEARIDGRLVVLPGEKLSKAAAAPPTPTTAPPEEPEDEDELEGTEAPAAGAPAGEGTEEGGTRRRRRRRGGRGRGRGRGGEAAEGVESGEAGQPAPAARREPVVDFDEGELEEPEPAPAPRAPRAAAFGSFWDTQIGMPSAPSAPAGEAPPDEDFEEPEIPEYLIAEQKRAGDARGRGGRGGPRGGRSAYVTAMERERFGGRGGGGINRYPDVGARGARPEAARPEPTRRSEPPRRPDRAPRPSSDEPWSEVPPELEAMLKAQLGTQGVRPEAPATGVPPAETGRASRGGRGRRSAEPSAEAAAAVVVAGSPAETPAPSAADEKPKRRTTRKAAAPAEASAGGDAVTAGDAPAEAAPKRRTTRKAAPSE